MSYSGRQDPEQVREQTRRRGGGVEGAPACSLTPIAVAIRSGGASWRTDHLPEIRHLARGRIRTSPDFRRSLRISRHLASSSSYPDKPIIAWVTFLRGRDSGSRFGKSV